MMTRKCQYKKEATEEKEYLTQLVGKRKRG